MAEDHRAPREDIIDVTIAIDVEKICPFAPINEDRIAADAAERPGRTIYPTGNKLFGAREG